MYKTIPCLLPLTSISAADRQVTKFQLAIKQENQEFSVLVLPSDRGRILMDDEEHVHTVDSDLTEDLCIDN